MNVGILGANGFVGRSLCLKYLNENSNVYAIYHKNSSLIPKGCSLISIDLAHNFDFDYLVIAIGGHGSTYQEFLNQYLFLDSIIKNYKYNKIIFISSVEVYGKNKNSISVESCFNNPSGYGVSKISQEFLIKSVPNYTIIRPTYLYGIGMNENSLIPIWINKAKSEKEIVVYGEGNRKQDYLHIDDLSQLCWLSTLSNENKNAIIAASGKSVSNFEVATEICKKVPDSIVKFFGEDNTESSYFDISHTQKKYNWTPKLAIKDWLNEYI